jgi:hypothetical protein
LFCKTQQLNLNNCQKQIIETLKSFERLAEKSVTELFALLQSLCSHSITPFELKNVVEAGITVRAFGDSNATTLKAVADLAAFMGTDVTEAAAAYGRAFAAGAGAADILRERGVLALIQTRSGIDDLTKLSLPEFRRVLFESLVDTTGPIAGATERLASPRSAAASG